MSDHYKIDRPNGIETWFLWQGEEIIRTGSLATVLLALAHREGIEGRFRETLPSEREEWTEPDYEQEMRNAWDREE